jgi:hypothetical protein
MLPVALATIGLVGIMLPVLRGNATCSISYHRVGSNGIATIAPVGVPRDHKLKEAPRAVPSGLGIDPEDLVPPTPLPQSQLEDSPPSLDYLHLGTAAHKHSVTFVLPAPS